MTERAILLMAYGTPATLDDVGPYFTHIRRGRAPSPEAIEHLRHRYEQVGGATPLRAITEAVRDRLEESLRADGDARRVYVGMKHWHPFIAETARQMAADGVREATAVVLAPHYSRMSVGGYRRYLDDALEELGRPFAVRFVERWHLQPPFVEMMAGLVREGLEQFPEPERDDVTVVFTAHSLPEKIREWDDPYERELRESAEAVAARAGLRRWRQAWQSAGSTGEPWIGPDILEFLETLRAEGVRRVLQVPIGFVSDHLEVLYDIDVEARARAAELGMRLERTRLPNATPELIRVLRAVTDEA
jgi:protoporphyrin/coproporphyrin ferrochelatase